MSAYLFDRHDVLSYLLLLVTNLFIVHDYYSTVLLMISREKKRRKKIEKLEILHNLQISVQIEVFAIASFETFVV